MEILLTAIVTWLSLNFALPAAAEHPRIVLGSPESMLAMRLGKEAAAATNAAAQAEIEALYDDATRTIYLRHGWTGSTPKELSVLVHEMVHHLQNLAGMTYECPEARERLAYEAQARWLELFGRDLMEEFELDPMTVLVRTRCMPS